MMRNVRLIARLDIKGENLIKSINLEGLKVVGLPQECALEYYLDGADELLYMDCVASLYGRNHLSEIVSRAAENIFIPMTVGGGIRSVDDALALLRAGADKVAVNTAAVAEPSLITRLATKLGSQSVVLSVEAKQTGPSSWEAYTDNGRERTGLNVLEWIQQGVELGAGEILLTSIDREGTRKGFDHNLIQVVTSSVTVPVIASGGMGAVDHAASVVESTMVDGVAMADILHYKRSTIPEIRDFCINRGLRLRRYDCP